MINPLVLEGKWSVVKACSCVKFVFKNLKLEIQNHVSIYVQ